MARKPDILKDQSLVLESINEFSEVSVSEIDQSIIGGVKSLSQIDSECRSDGEESTRHKSQHKQKITPAKILERKQKRKLKHTATWDPNMVLQNDEE